MTSTEILERLLDRIARFNPHLNAIVTLDREGARQRAREADAAAERGQWWGVLHGVPITIKDAFDTAGLRTVSGHPRLAQRVPTEDAVAVSHLRRAGAIILGKTNLPALANGIQSDNPVFGRTNNPWDLQRTPGGSSGGSAAAISAKLSYLDLGSDIGGSIRIPAHFCGVYGLKTTAGRVSGKGHVASLRPPRVPAGWERLMLLPSFGPLARSIDDLRLAFSVLTDSSGPAVEPLSPKPLTELRVAWTDDFGGAPLSRNSRRVIAGFIESLTPHVGAVSRERGGRFDFSEAWYTAGVCLGAANSLFQSAARQVLRRFAGPVLAALSPRDPLMRGIYIGASCRSAIVNAAFEHRERLIEQLEEFLDHWDVWICPVFPTAAFTHRSAHAQIEVDDQRVSMLRANLLHNVIFNVTGHPVVSVPIGLSAEGLPIGVQLVGRRSNDGELLNVAEQVASATAGFRRPPGF